MIGKTLGHYQITEKLGAGGMGVVYKARDLHLDRFVALKILPPEKVIDPDRKRRFVQEAKAASALNHPNIIHVYDIDQSEGTDYIAMEYVAGKTLDQRIGHRGLGPSDALKYAVQIADALAKAHSAGIVHRDVKPTNIMVNEDGVVKVLDFGLAKLTEWVQSDQFASTATMDEEGRPITEQGVIVGTVSYMSPEQAEGKKVDARSDIFSLGSVLYEMVTGQKAFQGTSKLSTLSAILHQEPKPVSGITPAIPADLERVINRCLRKDPAKRLQHMDDVKLTLDELRGDSDSGKLTAGAPERRRDRSYLWLSMILAAGALLAVAAWLWLGRSRPAAEEATIMPIPLTAYPGTETYPSFSPDGTQVAYQGCPEGWAPGRNCDIYVKQIGLEEPPFRLTDTPEQEYCPAWSPDGMFIAFLRQLSIGKLALIRIPQRGGLERVIAELNISIPSYLGLYGPSLAWTPDSKWIVAPDPQAGGLGWSLQLISIETGEKRNLTSAPKAEGGDTTPAFSPDGRILAFARMPKEYFSELWLLHLAEGYVPQGEPQRVASANPHNLGVAWTPDGSEIVFSSSSVASLEPANFGLWRVATSKPTGPRRLPFAEDNARAPAISRLGHRLAYSVERTDLNIWRVDLQGPDRKPGVPSKFISSTRVDGYPSFSPDGEKIAFYSTRSGSDRIWICDSDGSNPIPLSPGGTRPKWSPDHKSIAFDMNVGGNWDVYVIASDGGLPRRLTTDPAVDNWPSWSQDSQAVYFKSGRGGTWQIWKVPVGGGGAVQITRDPDGADLPRESPDGKFVYYHKGLLGPNTVCRLPVQGGEAAKLLDGVGSWTVGRDGVYFFTEPDEKGRTDLSIYEFATSKIRKIVTIERPVRFSIAASPDGRSILYTQVDESGSDLMLVENFR